MKKFVLALTVFALVMLPLAAMANGGIPLTGSRTETSGVTASDPWAEAFEITWEIKIFPTYVEYKYTLDVDEKEFSHFILEVSKGAKLWDFSWDYVEGPRTWSPDDPGSSNPFMPGDIYGIKFDKLDKTDHTFTFKSDRLPTWGDFYAKDGKYDGNEVYVFNKGFGKDPAPDYTDWIAVPDTVVAPIPGSLLLLGSGVLGLVGLRRKF